MSKYLSALKMTSLILRFLLPLSMLFSVSKAQFSLPGELDTSLNYGKPHSYFTDTTRQYLHGPNAAVNAILTLPNGQSIIGGMFDKYDGVNTGRVARLHADGSLDTAFRGGIGINDIVHALAKQPDGKILIGGWFSTVQGITYRGIARLNANGDLDTTFLTGSRPRAEVKSIIVQPDGRILVGGSFFNANNNVISGLLRLHANGTIDSTLSQANLNFDFNSMALQSDGRLLLAGQWSSGGSNVYRLIRILSNGAIDTSFNTGSGPDREIEAITIQQNGRILIGGNFFWFNGQTRRRLARLMPNGAVDNSFNNTGYSTQGKVRAIVQQNDGKIIAGGSFMFLNSNSLTHAMIRLESNGSVDSVMYTLNGMFSRVHALAIQSDGNLLAGGEFHGRDFAPRNYLGRWLFNGLLDSSFGTETGVNSSVLAIARQPDNKIIIGGWFSSVNGRAMNSIARLNEDGTLDTSFQVGTGIYFTESYRGVHALAIQNDGKILVGGYFNYYNGHPCGSLIRLLPNGLLDSSFTNTIHIDPGVHVIKLLPDGKILVGGSFTYPSWSISTGLVRLHPNGAFDSTFQIFGGVTRGGSFGVSDIGIMPNGQIIVVGSFSDFDFLPSGNIARVNSDGSLDTSFQMFPGADFPIKKVIVQPDGKVIIGGMFTSYNANQSLGLARLLQNGRADTSFSSPFPSFQSVETMMQHPDGRILVGNRNNLPSLFRMFPNGNLDSTFSVVANLYVQSTLLQPDGKLLVGGIISNYNGVNRNNLVRVHAEQCTTALVNSTNTNAICTGETKMLSGSVGSSWVISSGIGSISGSVFTAGSSPGRVYLYNVVGNCAGPMVSFDVFQSPIVSITRTGDTLKTNNTSGTFQWYLDGNPIPGGTSSTYIPYTSGVYTLNVTNAQGCTSTSNAINVLFASVKFDENKQLVWATYPVPFANELSIEAEQPFSYALLDVRGAVLQEGESTSNEITLSTGHLASGVYLMRIKVNGQTAFRRVVKQ